jgi:glutamine amidotransferase
MPAIAVIDYGMGNLRSVLNALEAIGCDAALAATPPDAAGAERLVLPGVGAFGDGIRSLRARGWADALTDPSERRPLLGICLGMQLLASTGEEHGHHDGLGLVPGAVRRLRPAGGERVPHVGWNDVRPTRPGALLACDGEGRDPAFYFVHSFHFQPAAPTAVTGQADHGGPVTAVVEHGHVAGVQFHPEKSQRDGLALLRRFAGC